jgi:hypothetical protein
MMIKFVCVVCLKKTFAFLFLLPSVVIISANSCGHIQHVPPALSIRSCSNVGVDILFFLSFSRFRSEIAMIAIN